jgi:hypothetical protein
MQTKVPGKIATTADEQQIIWRSEAQTCTHRAELDRAKSPSQQSRASLIYTIIDTRTRCSQYWVRNGIGLNERAGCRVQRKFHTSLYHGAVVR